MPALLAVLPNETPAMLFGTNKGASVFGSLNAAWRYGRRIAVPWRQVVLPATASALVFAFLGAAVVAWLPKDVLRPLVFGLLLLVLLYTLFKPDFGRFQGMMPRQPLIPALLVGALIGFYDGFFGPGTGSFLIFAFIRFFGFDFLRASVCAKVVNVATNLAALAFFVPHGQILWHLVGVMAVCNVLGAGLGSRLALKHGAGFVRLVFLAVGCASMYPASPPASSKEGALVAANGMTLYTFDKDVADSGKSACSGKCAENWPPFFAAEGDKAVGDFTVIVRDDGRRQWSYKGKPVYFWFKDQKPGDRSGDGFNGVWKVAR